MNIQNVFSWVFVLALFTGSIAVLGGALFKIGQWLLAFEFDNKEHMTHLAGTLLLLAFSIGLIIYASAT